MEIAQPTLVVEDEALIRMGLVDALEESGYVVGDCGDGASAMLVRRQNIRHNLRRRLAECGPRLGVDVRRRACGVASADVRWSFA